MNIFNIATQITKSDTGIWISPESEDISYTEDGHSLIKDSENESSLP